MVLLGELIVRLLDFLRLGLGGHVENFVVASLRPDHLAIKSKLNTLCEKSRLAHFFGRRSK
jgi:hypothetical protein